MNNSLSGIVLEAKLYIQIWLFLGDQFEHQDYENFELHNLKSNTLAW